MMTPFRLLVLLPVLLLAACANLPDRPQLARTTAFTDTADTPLGRAWQDDERRHGGRSAFYLLGNGLDAFVARAALVRLARRGIDMQYYMIHGDHVGSLLMNEVLRAADRGVRVRILLDDIDEGKRDRYLAVFDHHPNIEVRIFNPFGRNVSRIWQYLTGFGRQTRRAHNKLLVVDNLAAVVGGRNIGDEYFERDPDLAFQDLDLLAVGPAARAVSDSFDRYWNHRLSYPISLLVGWRPDEATYQRLLRAFRGRVASHRDSPYLERLRNSPLGKKLRQGHIDFTLAGARVVADDPDKLLKSTRDAGSRMMNELAPYLSAAREELIVISPYFVPGRRGVEFFRKLRKRGVRVRVLTNSLASTDVSVVHAGYSRYRRALLRMGVELWELNRITPRKARKKFREGKVGKAKTSLHAKAFVVDRKTLFIGSMNFDARSVVQNTEIGMVIDSPELARRVAAAFDKLAPQAAFRLELVKDKNTGIEKIRWRGREEGRPVTYDSEPHAGLLRRLGIFLIRWLPIESQI